MRRKLFIATSLMTILLQTRTFANDVTDAVFVNGLRTYKLPVSEQAYCYTNENGELEGVNKDKFVRLASTSKLVTSLWAIDKWGPNHKFPLSVYIKDHEMHLAGSLDPVLGNEKMMYLISELNARGYFHFSKITFDKNLIVYPNAAYGVEDYMYLTPEDVKKTLEKYFNTKKWDRDFKNEYSRFKYNPNPLIEADKIEFSNENSFSEDEDVRKLTITSPPLYKYLKNMNVNSNNYIAETLFRGLGGLENFNKYLYKKIGAYSAMVHFNTGSGLPKFIDGVRHDNQSTCRTMTNLMKLLDTSLNKSNKQLQDIVAVPGTDMGTFKNRRYMVSERNSFVAKTGTLTHVTTLLGALDTLSGKSYFGIYNEAPVINLAKKVQNNLVRTMMGELGGGVSFDYKRMTFDPVDGVSVRRAMTNIDTEENFSSISEEGLVEE